MIWTNERAPLWCDDYNFPGCLFPAVPAVPGDVWEDHEAEPSHSHQGERWENKRLLAGDHVEPAQAPSAAWKIKLYKFDGDAQF